MNKQSPATIRGNHFPDLASVATAGHPSFITAMLRFAARTPWEYFEAFPPPYCRLLAKDPGGSPTVMAVTDAELAIRSGLSLTRVREISLLESWDGVPMGEMRCFFTGCNFDPTNALHRERVTKYQAICTKRKTIPFHYLRRSPKWESEFMPLLVLVGRIMRSKSVLFPPTPTAVVPAMS